MTAEIDSNASARNEEHKTQIPPENPNPQSVKMVRRRLSVDGNDVSLDGVDTFCLDEVPSPLPDTGANSPKSCVGVYAGKSQKGYIPYNPRKVNQDYLLMYEDASTGTLLLGTFDGHGEHGHCISEVRSPLPLHA